MACTPRNRRYSAIIVISSTDFNHFTAMIYLALLSIPFIFVCLIKGQHSFIKIPSFIASDQVEYLKK